MRTATQTSQTQTQKPAATTPLRDHTLGVALFGLRDLMYTFATTANDPAALDATLGYACFSVGRLYDMAHRLERLPDPSLGYALGETAFTIEILLEEMVDAETEAAFVALRDHLYAACIVMAAEISSYLGE